MSDSLLREALGQHLAAVTPPAGDAERARRDGRRLRRRRRTTGAVVALGLTGAVAVGVLQVTGDRSSTDSVPDYPALGRLDFSEGLRAYADPGGVVHLGGLEVDASEMEYLDTDAVATPFGIVFQEEGRPMVLGEDGRVRSLVEGTVDDHDEWHPTAKADATSPQVAFATLRDDVATITVRDFQTGQDVASLDVACGRCDDLVLEGLDRGSLFYRDSDGTHLWEVGPGEPVLFAGPATRVVDVRGRTLLYDGPAPGSPRASHWTTLRAPVDASLTFDGRWVLDWSSTLRPTRPDDDPVVLEQGPREKGPLGFWAVDTDGSVLVAALTGKYPDYTVFDCAVPSGACDEVGPLSPEGGDPMFIGADM